MYWETIKEIRYWGNPFMEECDVIAVLATER